MANRLTQNTVAEEAAQRPSRRVGTRTVPVAHQKRGGYSALIETRPVAAPQGEVGIALSRLHAGADRKLRLRLGLDLVDGDAVGELDQRDAA